MNTILRTPAECCRGAEWRIEASSSKCTTRSCVRRGFRQTAGSRAHTTYLTSQLAPIRLNLHGRPTWMCRAGALDVMPAWTLDQIAGLAFGAVMIAFVVSARQVDIAVARAQRRQLGLCEECGGLYEPASCQQNNCPAKRGGQAG